MNQVLLFDGGVAGTVLRRLYPKGQQPAVRRLTAIVPDVARMPPSAYSG